MKDHFVKERKKKQKKKQNMDNKKKFLSWSEFNIFWYVEMLHTYISIAQSNLKNLFR